MASSTENHKVRDPTSSVSRTGTDSRHNPQNFSFTSQSWADKAKQQERSSFNIAPNLNNAFDDQNVQSYFSQTTPFLEATEPYSIVMDCAQFEGMTFDNNKEFNEILREQFPDGLILIMRAVGRTKKFFEISFINEEGRVATLNHPFNIQGKAIVVSPTLGSGACIVRVGITGIPGLDSLVHAGIFWNWASMICPAVIDSTDEALLSSTVLRIKRTMESLTTKCLSTNIATSH